MRWLFHLGPNKTGTTSTQFALNSKRAELARSGVLYPASGIVNAAHHMYNFALSVEIQGAAPYAEALGIRDIPSLEDLVAQTRKEAGDHGCNTILVSSETLWTWPALRVKRLREALAGDSASVVAVLRPHFERELSMWQEEIKHGYLASAITYLVEHSDSATSDTGCVLDERLGIWSLEDFEIQVATFPQKHHSNIWNVLLEALDIRLISKDSTQDMLNPSLDYVAAESLRQAFTLLTEAGTLDTTPKRRAVPIEEVFVARDELLAHLEQIERPRFGAYSALLAHNDLDSVIADKVGLYALDLARIKRKTRDLDIAASLSSLVTSPLAMRAQREDFERVRPELDALATRLARHVSERQTKTG